MDNNVYLNVNNSLEFTRSFDPNMEFSIYLPGFYLDGDGGGSGDSNTTNSIIDNFNFTTTVVPEPISSTLFVVGAATLGFRRFRKKITN